MTITWFGTTVMRLLLLAAMVVASAEDNWFAFGMAVVALAWFTATIGFLQGIEAPSGTATHQETSPRDAGEDKPTQGGTE